MWSPVLKEPLPMADLADREALGRAFEVCVYSRGGDPYLPSWESTLAETHSQGTNFVYAMTTYM